MSSTFIIILHIYAWLFLLQNLGFMLVASFWVFRFKIKSRKFEREFNSSTLPASAPGVSILVSLKGSLQVAGKGITNLCQQNYPGPVEVIFITEHGNDPAVEVVSKALKNIKSNTSIKWVYDEPLTGANPRTAKMLKGLEKTSHDYIYWTSPDIVVSQDFLAQSLSETQFDQKTFATAIPVQTGAKNLWAMLENMYYLWGGPNFFCISDLMKQPQVFGGSLVFHKSLLGNTQDVLGVADFLTEEEPLTKLFLKNGGQVKMLPFFSLVYQEEQPFKELYDRSVRWMQIARFHHKFFYFSSILYSSFWLLMAYGLTNNPFFLTVFTAYLAMKLVNNLFYHIILGLPISQVLSTLLMPIYEFMIYIYTVHSLLQKRLNWRGDILDIEANGKLIRVKN